MVSLDSALRMILVQFSFSNSTAIPKAVMHEDPETYEQSQDRQKRATGRIIIQPTEGCCLDDFPREMGAADFELVKAFSQERIDQNNSQRTYWMVRFVFVHIRHVDLSDEFFDYRKTTQADELAALKEMCHSALWRVRAYRNPFYQEGEEVPGFHAVSINLEARHPRFGPDGKPILVWEKDSKGKRVGDKPLPIKPKRVLRASKNTIELVSA